MNEIKSLVEKVNSSRRIGKILNGFCIFITVLTVAEFALLAFLFYKKSPVFAVEYLITLGAPFLTVSLIRRLIDAKRPYQVYEFIENPWRRGDGESFPSRHCFSIFAIGTLGLFAGAVGVVTGIVTLFLGALLCFIRVALGIHFPRDVLAGALIGICTSVIGGLIFFV